VFKVEVMRKALFQAKESFYEIKIGMMNNTLNAKSTFAFVGFLGEQVTSCGLSVSDLTAAGNLKSFFCP
jgi:hypothetical protein